MVFIVYSHVTEENLPCSLGIRDYSYYFVLRGFLPVLKELGQVLAVSSPEQEVDVIYDACQKRGEKCVFMSFSPPNQSAVGLRCPTVCVLAWEFDSIPDEPFDNDPRNDWRFVLSDHGRAITLSRYSAESVKKSMGEGFSVAAIPAPVWDAFENFRNHTDNPLTVKSADISIRGNVIDSRNYYIAPDAFELLNPFDNFQLKNWTGEKLHLKFSKADECRAYLGGFYYSEIWGSWSRIEQPWVLLPYRISGTVCLKISARAYANNVNKQIVVSLGGEKKWIRFKEHFTERRVSFRLMKPDSILRFSGLDATPIPGAEDPRSMGIGLRYIEITGAPDSETKGNIQQEAQPGRQIKLEGVVYTSVFCPTDGRKNWEDMLTAFCKVFQDVEDATLVLKMTHNSLSSFLEKLHFVMQQLSPFKCRVLALQGYMDQVEYEKLIAITDYYVNVSRCEGLCLPLMEFMACRKPALSPCHTAMADYVDFSSTLIVDSSLEPCTWPHDSRTVFRAMRYRINWESLVNAYRQSYHIAKNQPDTYKQMAQAASAQIKKFASNNVVKEKLQRFLLW
jgi:glycosyltransferase involved in cell wall biosynthesis